MKDKKQIAMEILDECASLVEHSLDAGEGLGLSAYEVIAGVLNSMYMRDTLMSELRQQGLLKDSEPKVETDPLDNVYAFKKEKDEKYDN